jgi:hypothetical protein
MTLLLAMYRRLTALVAGSGEAQTRKSSTKWGVGGRWFCPRDRALLIESEGVVECGRCELDLTSAVYELIEVHHHA